MIRNIRPFTQGSRIVADAISGAQSRFATIEDPRTEHLIAKQNHSDERGGQFESSMYRLTPQTTNPGPAFDFLGEPLQDPVTVSALSKLGANSSGPVKFEEKTTRLVFSTLLKMSKAPSGFAPLGLANHEKTALGLYLIKALNVDESLLAHHSEHVSDDSMFILWHLLQNHQISALSLKLAQGWIKSIYGLLSDKIVKSLHKWHELDCEQRLLFAGRLASQGVALGRKHGMCIDAPRIGLINHNKSSNDTLAVFTIPSNCSGQGNILLGNSVIGNNSGNEHSSIQGVKLVLATIHELTHAWQYTELRKFQDQSLKLLPKAPQEFWRLQELNLSTAMENEMHSWKDILQSPHLPNNVSPVYTLPHEVQAWTATLLAMKLMFEKPEFSFLTPEVQHLVNSGFGSLDWLNKQYKIWDLLDESSRPQAYNLK